MVDRRRAPAFVVILPKNARTGIEPSAAPRSVPIETLLKGELMDGSP
jgi:hypothetical protein